MILENNNEKNIIAKSYFMNLVAQQLEEGNEISPLWGQGTDQTAELDIPEEDMW